MVSLVWPCVAHCGKLLRQFSSNFSLPQDLLDWDLPPLSGEWDPQMNGYFSHPKEGLYQLPVWQEIAAEAALSYEKLFWEPFPKNEKDLFLPTKIQRLFPERIALSEGDFLTTVAGVHLRPHEIIARVCVGVCHFDGSKFAYLIDSETIQFDQPLVGTTMTDGWTPLHFPRICLLKGVKSTSLFPGTFSLFCTVTIEDSATPTRRRQLDSFSRPFFILPSLKADWDTLAKKYPKNWTQVDFTSQVIPPLVHGGDAELLPSPERQTTSKRQRQSAEHQDKSLRLSQQRRLRHCLKLEDVTIVANHGAVHYQIGGELKILFSSRLATDEAIQESPRSVIDSVRFLEFGCSMRWENGTDMLVNLQPMMEIWKKRSDLTLEWVQAQLETLRTVPMDVEISSKDGQLRILSIDVPFCCSCTLCLMGTGVSIPFKELSGLLFRPDRVSEVNELVGQANTFSGPQLVQPAQPAQPPILPPLPPPPLEVPTKKPRGMKNPSGSNTCWLNSLLQCLSQMMFHPSVPFKPDMSGDSFFTGLFKWEQALTPKEQEYERRVFYASVKIWFKETFGNGRQHDVHEFFVALFGTHMPKRWRYLFRWYDHLEIKCPSCQQVTKKHNDWCLDLAVSTRETVSESILDYCAEETLTQGNEWTCNKCAQSVLPTTKRAFGLLPTLLAVQLKIFDDQSRKISSGKVVKLEHTVTLNAENGKNAMYTLEAAVFHAGRTIQSGHYTALRRKNNEIFYHCNDEMITETSLNDLPRGIGDPYLLFYRRKTQ